MESKQIVSTVAGMVIKIGIAIVVLFIIFKLTIATYNFGYRIFGEKPISEGEGREVSVAIVEGKSVKEIGKILVSKGLIRDANLFYIQELLSAYHNKLKPGIHVLSTSMTPEEMMEVMSREQEETESDIKIPDDPIQEEHIEAEDEVNEE